MGGYYNIFYKGNNKEGQIHVEGQWARLEASDIIDVLLDAGYEVESDMWNSYCGKYE